jgi:hypothetical protein
MQIALVPATMPVEMAEAKAQTDVRATVRACSSSGLGGF